MKILPSAAFRYGLVLTLVPVLQLVPVQGANFLVNVNDNVFQPSTLTVNVNDKVGWHWIGINSHSSTSSASPSPLWDSGIRSSGAVFTNTFANNGTFPYHCDVHLGQTASITVGTPNNPPSVSISSPTNNSIFAAPWSGTIVASSSDSDGTVQRLDFFAGTTLLGRVTNPPSPVSFDVTNLAAGTYSLKGVATDNGGATTSSGLITVVVRAPVPIQITSPVWTPPSTFAFTYSTTAGLHYVVQKGTALDSLVPFATNTPSAPFVHFTDSSATDPGSFYSVILAPNP